MGLGDTAVEYKVETVCGERGRERGKERKKERKRKQKWWQASPGDKVKYIESILV